MKILCIGDQHFQPSNERETEVFLKELEKHLQNTKYDYIFSMGDLLHTHEKLHTLALNKAVEYINLLKSYAPTYIIVGNHDYTSNTTTLNGKHWLVVFKDWENVKIVDTFTMLENDTLLLSPYICEGKFIENIHKQGIDLLSGKIKCVFSHQTFNGVKMGAIVAEDTDDWKEEYPMMVSGHIHDTQWVSKNLYYTGSAMQHAFGEKDDKCLCSVTIDDKVSIDKVYLNLIKKKIIYMSIPEIQKYDVSNLEENVVYKFTIDGSQEEFDAFRKTKKFKDLREKNIKINFKHKRDYVQVKKDNLQKHREKKDYRQILEELIKREDDLELEYLYKKYVLNLNEEILIF